MNLPSSERARTVCRTAAYLEMRGITKVYREREVKANDKADLSVAENEIHAIVGENGAGKTTLMKVLYGLEQPDEGEILFRGRNVTIENPLAADRLGIGMVHQHFKLIGDFTVAENVVLGIEPRSKWVFFDRPKAVAAVNDVMRENGFSIDPRRKASTLSVGQMQQVEIVKMLYRQADLLILDEPTSVLTEQEVHALFTTLRKLKDAGKTIILITHKLNEVKDISSRVTVMKKGRVIAVRNTAEVDKRELAKLMVGRTVLFDVTKEEKSCGAAVMELKNVTVTHRGQDRPLLDSVNLQIRSCEIVGAAGVSGNGLEVLEDVAAGLRKVSSGRLYHNGEDVTGKDTLRLREQGLAYVPADRLSRGSSLGSTVRDNMIIARHHDFLQAGFFKRKEVRAFAEGLIKQFDIDGHSSDPIGTLSGGNIQKVILARELAGKTDFIIFSEPTWGLDVASSQFVYAKILEMKNAGAGILLISSDLDEIIGLADTVVIMHRGRIVAKLRNNDDLDKELIGEYMLGLRDDFSAEQKTEERAGNE